MIDHLVVTVLAEDRPGIVESISQTVSAHTGNWMESRMNRLAGKFAGILLIEVASQNSLPLQEALAALNQQGISIRIENSTSSHDQHMIDTCIDITANDRPGIVNEIAALLSSNNVNLKSLETFCASAPMSAGIMFHAQAYIQLPEALSQDDLMRLLESLSDDLMVEVVDI
jgi:glycine cleavage system regulatory protein|tara:strand:- start:341 stop:853 length:513 start_codon:yes stop_codon:yes gene_type:complete